MEVIFFLFVACCVSFIVLICAIAFFSPSLPRPKHQPKSRLPQQPLPEDLKAPKQDIVLTELTYAARGELDRTPSVKGRTIWLKQAPLARSFQNLRLSRNHLQNIQDGYLMLEELRTNTVEPKFPFVVGRLRRLNPCVFEELLLTCCEDQGWEIKRNKCYSNDGGVDGRVWIAGNLYLIQAKRYRGYINPQHVRNFQEVVKAEQAAGGFFIHTGKTGSLSKSLICESQIYLISGQRLVDFVLGEKLKIVDVTICTDLNANN